MVAITDIQESLLEELHRHLDVVIRAFEQKNVVDYMRLSFEKTDGNKRDDKNTWSYIQELMDCGLKVADWSAKPYKQPRWSIFKEFRLDPSPLIWVDVFLHNAENGHKVEIFLALAVDADGRLKQCDYVEK